MQLCAPRQSLNHSPFNRAFAPCHAAMAPCHPAMAQSNYQMSQLPDYQMQVCLWLS